MRALVGFPRRLDKHPGGIRFHPLQGPGQQCGDSMRRVRYAGNCNRPTSWAQEAGERKNSPIAGDRADRVSGYVRE